MMVQDIWFQKGLKTTYRYREIEEGTFNTFEQTVVLEDKNGKKHNAYIVDVLALKGGTVSIPAASHIVEFAFDKPVNCRKVSWNRDAAVVCEAEHT